jgi:hypothetical protein
MKHTLFSLIFGLLSVVQMHAATITFVYDDTKTEKENIYASGGGAASNVRSMSVIKY